MNAVKREDVPVAIEGDGVELRMQEIGGDLTVAFVHLPKGADLRPALPACRTTCASARTGAT